jgi:hypothetical protein
MAACTSGKTGPLERGFPCWFLPPSPSPFKEVCCADMVGMLSDLLMLLLLLLLLLAPLLPSEGEDGARDFFFFSPPPKKPFLKPPPKV